MTYKIRVPQADRILEAEEGASLFETLRANGLTPESPCGGKGSCGKCKVTVNGEERLACRTRVDSDMTVILPGKEKTKVLTIGLDVKTDIAPVREGLLTAFDIGTTTVVCYLMDGETGDVLANASMLNPQQPYGADVISRIQAAMDGALEAQKKLIQDGMCSLIKECCDKAGRKPEEIGVVSVVGNPTMQQLFMGIPTDNLAKIPFAPVLTEPKAVSAAEYLPVCPNAELLVVPDISGYVGADTMGCVVSTEMYKNSGMTLMVDIGTNGEMVLGNSEKMMACSTAAGPALEGAKIKFGMRGAPGAIDHVKIEDGKLICSVIGGGEAKGICGSGLIDAVAAALELGLINKRGRIQCTDERDGERFIPLTEDVYLTQNDIREVQLAKGAISAGIRLMAQELNIELEDIEKVLLAGAFGSFMNPVKACRIGLLPEALDGKVTAVGNAAGSGAKMMVCSERQFRLTGELLEKIEFLELAKLPEFQMTFALCMMFEEPDFD